MKHKKNLFEGVLQSRLLTLLKNSNPHHKIKKKNAQKKILYNPHTEYFSVL